MLDFIVVGQGLAGSVLSYKLVNRGYSVKVIDSYSDFNSTMASAGIMNPITGRSFVKTWKVETLWKEAIETYKLMEQQFKTQLVFPLELYRNIPTVELENNWCSRFLEDSYQNYLDHDQDKTVEYKSRQYGIIKNVYRIDLNAIKRCMKEFLQERGWLINEVFEHQQIEINDEFVEYKGIKAKAIIFSEGYLVKDNPFFNYLPIRLNRGESISFKHKELQEKRMIKNQFFVVPQENDQYWSGGGYDRDNLQVDKPLYLDKIKGELESFYELSINEYDFRSGVRPGVIDRRPVVGSHPLHNKLYIFNGMGTKGASLCPYCAEELINKISDGIEMDPVINVIRFTKS